MSWEYTDLALLRDGHTDSITALAISYDGTHIATGSVGGDVCIWELYSQKVIYSYHGGVAILVLRWAPGSQDLILCGMACGYLTSLSIHSGTISVYGFRGHSYPVDCLDVNGSLVASGAQNQVRIWEWLRQESWKLRVELREPYSLPQEGHLDVVVTSVVWSSCGARLFATYLHHGIRVYDTATWTCSQIIRIDGQAAFADLSHDNTRIIVSNLSTGFDLYTVTSGDHSRAFGHDFGSRRATPVKFVERSDIIVGGTTVGEMVLWDTSSGRRIQTLTWENHRVVLALDTLDDRVHGRFLIAAGPYDGVDYTIRIWSKRILGEPGAEAYIVHGVQTAGMTLGNLMANLKYWILAGLVILAAYTLRGPY